MRKRLFEIIEKGEDNDRVSLFYDWFMIVVIVASLVPLGFKTTHPVLLLLDKITVMIFIVDYMLRWITADYKFPEKKRWSFLMYPFSIMAVVDLISILPSLTIVNNGLKALRILRMIRALRVFRVVKAFRYSKAFEIIGKVIRSSKDSLVAVCALASGYIVVSALIVFNVEPESFDTFFDAIYWATVSLTTVGYGDIYPVTGIGRLITMISSIFGIAIVALPAGIITAGYMNEISKADKEEKLK
ncbi:MAG: ion transporter [Lachnospiraceae bacterium]|nr:ion transporter [Lachnospiraceae bacterium]